MKSIDVIIETPKGSALKYNYDPASHFFELRKILPSGMVFPYDFGFIPGTKGEDGDPVDIIVVSEFESFPGCKMKCRLIGGIKAEQSEKKGSVTMVRNDRFIAIPDYPSILENISSISDIPDNIFEQLENFFITYNKLAGKEFKALKKLGRKEAYDLIMEARSGK